MHSFIHFIITALALAIAIAMVDITICKDPQLQKETIAFIIERSLNKNIVVYEGLIHEESKQLRTDKPIDAYWLDIDPAYVEKNRKNGKMHDRDELNLIERKMAYGVSWEPIEEEEGGYTMTLVALPKRKGIFKLVNGTPKAIMEINGQQCYMQSIYVESKQGMIGLPRVVYVVIKGVSIESGEPQEEKIDG
jgi:hypothetical protein